MHIGIFGLSGSGKTTLARRLAAMLKDYTSTSASHLLRMRGQTTSLRELAAKQLPANQDVLVEEYRQLKKTTKNTIIELHAVIETSDSLYWVPASTLENLELDGIFFLKADPNQISKRREQAIDKERVHRSGTQLFHLQEDTATYLKKAYGEQRIQIVEERYALHTIHDFCLAEGASPRSEPLP